LAAVDTAVGKNKKARSNAGFFFCSMLKQKDGAR
jgi:hypothetical protein